VKQKRIFNIKNFNDLRLRVFTIGYPVMGESILVLLCNGDEVLFTAITDCYCIDKGEGVIYNHIDTILSRFNIEQIDVFIWTHPDKDHSLGIENVLNCYDKQHKAEIFIPEGLIDQRKIEGSLCEDSCTAIDFLYSNYSNKNSQRTKRRIHTVSVDDHEVRDLLLLEIYADGELLPLTCKYRFVLPYAEFSNHANFWDMEMEHNLMSIVYSIEINGRNYLFTGDLLDDGTRMMSEEVFARINYIKIPHHGSEHSKEFQYKVKHFCAGGIIATTTRFNNSKDPKESTLMAYRDMGEVYYITDEQSYCVGCIETEVDVINDICITKCVGNASRYKV